MRFVLDTHIFFWWVTGAKLEPAQRKILQSPLIRDEPFYIPSIALWEIAMAYERKRLQLDIPLSEWLGKAAAIPHINCYPITPAITAETAMLPSWFHRDPADRLIVATARVLGAKLLTSDERIIQSGLVETI